MSSGEVYSSKANLLLHQTYARASPVNINLIQAIYASAGKQAYFEQCGTNTIERRESISMYLGQWDVSLDPIQQNVLQKYT